jgi:hypothetical protein
MVSAQARVSRRLSPTWAARSPAVTNLLYMRSFAEAWPDPEIVQRVVGRLLWGQNIELITKLKDFGRPTLVRRSDHRARAEPPGARGANPDPPEGSPREGHHKLRTRAAAGDIAPPVAITRWMDPAVTVTLPEADGTLATAREIAEAASRHAHAANKWPRRWPALTR